MKDIKLIRQVDKAKLAISALEHAYRTGEIDLKSYVEAEDSIGRSYARWAEYQDKTDAGNFYKRERPSGLKPMGVE